MTERGQLEQAVAAQESLRATPSDAVVDAATAALRKQLAEMESQATSTPEQHKQVTVLFCDLVGFAPIAEEMDPEDVHEVEVRE